MTEAAINPTNGIPSPWTDDRVELLKRLWDNGLSCSLIAAEMGDLTRNAVIGKVSRLGLPGRKSTHFMPREMVRRPSDRGLRQSISNRLKREPDPEIKEPPAPPEFLGIALLDLKPRQCRFPQGEGADILFCGQPVQVGYSFCPTCYRIVYRRGES